MLTPTHAKLTLADRVASYRSTFPEYPDSWPVVSPTGRWLNAIWLGGNNYKGNGYYGSYPPWYLPRVRALFPEIDVSAWWHLYAGSLGDDAGGRRLELREPMEGVGRMHVRADCRQLPLQSGRCRLLAADPPYTDLDAEVYHTPPGLNKPLVMTECARVTQPGGFLIWLDTSLPMYNGDYWYHFGMICVQRSSNHRTRLCSLFQRTSVPPPTLSMPPPLTPVHEEKIEWP